MFPDALARFERACILNPNSDVGCLNMGIAMLNMQDYDDARRTLTRSAQLKSHNPRTWFNLGLLERAMGNLPAAQNDFEKVATLDSHDADTQYFLGYLAAESQNYDEAIGDYKKALELEPFHASAEYALSQAEQNTGDAADAKIDLEKFQRITTNRLSKPIRFVYGEQGKYSFAEEMPVPEQHASAALPVRFVNVTELSGLPTRPDRPASLLYRRGSRRTRARASNPVPSPESFAQFLGSGACVFDYDGDGLPDIFLVNADGSGNAALFRNQGHGKFLDVTKAAHIDFHGEGMGCATGDYDNDGHTDLVVSSSHSLTLLHNEGDGTFKDVTDETGVRTETPDGALILGVTFVDYDGDGDLDLYVTRLNNFHVAHLRQPFFFPDDSKAPGNVLWRNQGGGKFTDVTEKVGVAGSASGIGAIPSDLTNTGALDLVLTGWSKFPTVLLNSREGYFRDSNPWAISMPGPAAGGIAFDFDRDGWMDLAFTHWAPPGLSVWHNIAGKSFERIPLVAPGWMRGWGVSALDYDNDGWVDLVAVGETFSGEGRIALFRNAGPSEHGNFRDVTQQTGLDKIVLRDPRSVIAFDAEGNGSTYLLITQNGLPPILLKATGGDKNGWMQLQLAGDPDNKTGLGAKIDILAGAQRQTVETGNSSGYLGQGPAAVSLGLGPEEGVDVVRIHWPTGVLQDEIGVRAESRVPIAESEAGDAPN